MVETTSRRRCAIYTRKSTDEGLEKEFNSLDAQHDACSAYIMSQAHEGWTRLAERYDDGGYSGGSMERPALQRLLADVEAGKVDVIVVYKIDRLTRSLADFAKIVETLDKADCSFVSVTQSFNTTSSMGRLTLNVLLSFAQFEREVAAERIRDKIAASKKRGMWMGGPVPLGYEVKKRKLFVVEKEAETVREIMRRYLESDGVPSLVEELESAGIVSKLRKMRNGSYKGGSSFRRGALAHLLSNRIYLGQIVHKGSSYEGEHDAIVDPELFKQVQERLADHRSGKERKQQKAEVSILAGRIVDEHGRPMTPCHTKNHGKRYRYYASVPRDGSKEKGTRLRAAELEEAVKSALARHLRRPTELVNPAFGLADDERASLASDSLALAHHLIHATGGAARELLDKLDLQIKVDTASIGASISIRLLLPYSLPCENEQKRSRFVVPASLKRLGHEHRLRLDPPAGSHPSKNSALIDLIARALAAREQLISMSVADVKAMPASERRHIERTAKISYLAPDIVLAIIDGKQPEHLSARKLVRAASLPVDWAEQRHMLLQN